VGGACVATFSAAVRHRDLPIAGFILCHGILGAIGTMGEDRVWDALR
jgi:hypothetical protein